MKKAQSQIHESIIVIFIFSIIFAMALFGVYRYNTLSVQGIQKDIEESRSLSLLNNLPGSPLIQQSELGNKNVVSIPVSLYFPLTKEVKVGKLTITTYE